MTRFPNPAAAALAWLLIAGGGTVWADALAESLEPHVGQQIDVIELATGKRFVRPLLQKLVVREGTTQALRLVEEGQ